MFLRNRCVRTWVLALMIGYFLSVVQLSIMVSENGTVR